MRTIIKTEIHGRIWTIIVVPQKWVSIDDLLETIKAHSPTSEFPMPDFHVDEFKKCLLPLSAKCETYGGFCNGSYQIIILGRSFMERGLLAHELGHAYLDAHSIEQGEPGACLMAAFALKVERIWSALQTEDPQDEEVGTKLAHRKPFWA